MGDWIKNNKFEALLLLVVILVGLGAYVYGSGKGRAYTEAKASFDEHAQSVARLKGKKPFPDQAKAAAFEEQVDAYEEVVNALENKMAAYRPETFEQIPPPRFIENLNTARAEVARALEARRVEYPEDKFYLGFESYTGTLPKEPATAYLDYQLTALKALFETVAAARPSALLNVHRPKLPVEEGKSMDATEEPATGRGGRRTSRKPKGPSAPYYRLPVEVTFRSTEPVARQILSDLASHKDHYFVVRSIRIQNEERDNAPEKDEVQFDAPPAAEPAGGEEFEEFEDFEDADDPAAPADPEAPAEPAFPEEEDEPVAGTRVLGQVLGREQIFVLLEIDVLLFKPKASEEGEGS